MLFLASLFSWSLLAQGNIQFLTLLALSLLLLWLYEHKLSIFFKSARLLSWFFLPIILFQGLFTPGTYIQEPFYIPLSVEGLKYAFTLCLHIATLFVVALLFSRLITVQEWHNVLSKSAKLNNLFKPYLILMQAMKGYVAQVFRLHYRQWKNNGRNFRQLPKLLAQLIEQVISNAKKEANHLWLEWDSHFLHAERTGRSRYSVSDYLYGVSVAIGWSLFWIQ